MKAGGGGGGAYSSILNSCILISNSAVISGGGTYGATLNNCALSGNISFQNGGGAYGGTLNNCILTSNAVTDASFGNGGGASNASLTNCTISGNSARENGGGVYSAKLKNCVLTGNNADYGGGAYIGTLNNCTLTGNSARSGGGGIYGSTLNNCILTGNNAINGGGISGGTMINCLLIGNLAATGGGSYASSLYNCTVYGNYATNSGGGVSNGGLFNCIVYFNLASNGSNYSFGNLNYCCTMPLPASGTANFTNAPNLVNMAGGNFRLQTNSPCINAGNNAYASTSTDLDGRPRIIGGTVDVGAYEFQGQGIGEFTSWLQQYGLPTDGTADFVDADGDGMNNWQEWIAGTNPTNAASFLQMLSATNSLTGAKVTWQSVSGKTYYLLRSTNLAAAPAFTALVSNLPGAASTTSYTDTTATNGNAFFYRVGVQ
jgi:parallel beta-helix repeat protein/predicted outer membrane repeat protein